MFFGANSNEVDDKRGSSSSSDMLLKISIVSVDCDTKMISRETEGQEEIKHANECFEPLLGMEG